MDTKSPSTSLSPQSGLYRQARSRLLQEELNLRKSFEDVAIMRKALPLGIEVKENYVFAEVETGSRSVSARSTHFFDLFQRVTTLAVYSLLHHPEDEIACSTCDQVLRSLNDALQFATDRFDVAVVFESSSDRAPIVRDTARTGLRFLYCAGNTYNNDFQWLNSHRQPVPTLNIFVRRGRKVHHFYGTEIRFLADQETRQSGLTWHLWNLFEFTPNGNRTDWHPAAAETPIKRQLKCA